MRRTVQDAADYGTGLSRTAIHSFKEPAMHSLPTGNHVSRRHFLRGAGLGLGGLMLGDLLRLRAEEGAPRTKSVIMVLLIGGPSHIDMYDMKPDAPTTATATSR